MQSQEALRKHRNMVVHVMPAKASFRLACAAYFTAVEVSRHIEAAFFAGREFRYQGFLDRYPCLSQERFHAIISGEHSVQFK